jgi:hypothetical protein
VRSVRWRSLARRFLFTSDWKRNKRKQRTARESGNEEQNYEMTSAERNGKETPETKKIYWLLIQ